MQRRINGISNKSKILPGFLIIYLSYLYFQTKFLSLFCLPEMIGVVLNVVQKNINKEIPL